MIHRREFLALGTLSVFGVAGAEPVAAQTWPNRSVRLVVPYPPGGTTDGTARIVSDWLSRAWGQAVVIENKPGQGTNIGAETVARADPDGYTMLVVASSTAANKNIYRSLKYDLVTDLAPVSRLVTFPLVFLVPASSPVKSIADLIAQARERNGTLTYGTPAYAGLNHLTGELFSRMAGIRMTHVPYRGDALAMTDLMAGRLDLQIAGTVQLEQARSGHARALAVTTVERLAAASDIPTIAESGLPGFNVQAWFGLMVPAKVPPDIVKKMNVDTMRALGDATVKARLESIGVIVAPSTPEELASFIKAEIAKWEAVIKEAGIRVEG
ncbi:MAG: tripartite tricarboxylate transporter substrate binding protein [Xanthobacteraceae bacterium]